MTHRTSRVTIHMVASLDGFVARKDGRVDWLEVADEYAAGVALDQARVEAVLKSIDCYVMGARTYEVALGFESKGYGWAYGDTPTMVLTHGALPKTRRTVEFHQGDLAAFIGTLRGRFQNIWVVGGGTVVGECLRLGIADELRYAMVPIAIGEGLPFFGALNTDVPMHLTDVTAYKNGMVELVYGLGLRA